MLCLLFHVECFSYKTPLLHPLVCVSVCVCLFTWMISVFPDKFTYLHQVAVIFHAGMNVPFNITQLDQGQSYVVRLLAQIRSNLSSRRQKVCQTCMDNPIAVFKVTKSQSISLLDNVCCKFTVDTTNKHLIFGKNTFLNLS